MYDPTKTYAENYEKGPYGDYAIPIPYHNGGKPMHEFLGHPLYSRFGIPAGPLLNANYVSAAFAKGFDVVTYKTQRSIAFEANPFPNVLYVDTGGDLTLKKAAKPVLGRTTAPADPANISITNSFAMPSTGPIYWVPDFKKAQAAVGRGQLLIMSVVGTIKPGYTASEYYDDFATVTKIAVQAGARVVELNLSCPNVANEGVLCYTPSAVIEICKRAKAVAGPTPLMIKIGYYTPEQEELLEDIVLRVARYIDGICAINTISAPIVNERGEQALPGPNRLKSGVCGAGIKWAGLDMTRRLAAIRKKLNLKFKIVGVGGVMTPADYQEYLDAGADLVQSATGAMWNAELAIDIKAAVK